MRQFDAKEKFCIINTLCCVPYMLQGNAVLIDLINETSIAGVLDLTDGHMNLHLTEAVLIDRNGGQRLFDEFMVRSRMIRHIHIPESIDIAQELRTVMDEGIFRRKRVLKKSDKKRTFKQKRAQVRHQEVLDHIRQQKESKDKEQQKQL